MVSLFRLITGWAAVSVWFVLWDLARQKVGTRKAAITNLPRATGLGTHLALPLAEALLLTLFSALWFASLGRGGWVLLFILLALLMEGPARFRDGQWRVPPPWARLAGSVVRIVAAGGVLAWRLG